MAGVVYKTETPPMPFTLTLSDNQLTGSVPHSLLAGLNATKNKTNLLIANNRLSCNLPRLEVEPQSVALGQQSVVLIGNRFSKKAKEEPDL